MTIVRWDPFSEMTSLRSEMDRLFNSVFDSPTTGNAGNGARAALRRWNPPMDLLETTDHFVLRADLPGVSEEDVKIELEDNVLTVSGERRSAHEESGQGFYRFERGFGAFSRSLTLPDGIDAAAIEASFDRGVLEVRIPKPEERKPVRVAISVGGADEEQPAIEGAEAADKTA